MPLRGERAPTSLPLAAAAAVHHDAGLLDDSPGASAKIIATRVIGVGGGGGDRNIEDEALRRRREKGQQRHRYGGAPASLPPSSSNFSNPIFLENKWGGKAARGRITLARHSSVAEGAEGRGWRTLACDTRRGPTEAEQPGEQQPAALLARTQHWGTPRTLCMDL